MSLNSVLNGVQNITSKTAGFVSTAASWAGRIGHFISGEDDSPNFIRDVVTNGFLPNKKSLYNPNVFSRYFDEPTYLSFRIKFIFNDPIRNLSYGNNIDGTNSMYYTTMYDYMPEPFLQPRYENRAGGANDKIKFDAPYDDSEYLKYNHDLISETGDKDSKFFTTTNDINTQIGTLISTEYYLDGIAGDHGRAYLLKQFKNALYDIEYNYPYYFTEISGLESLNKIEYNKGVRVKDGKVTIKCEDGVDMKITQLLQMYRKIVWDDVYQRWVLPDMMRYFSMNIYISEIRFFHEIKGTLNSKEPKTYDFTNGDIRNMHDTDKTQWTDILDTVTSNLGKLSNNIFGKDSGLAQAVNSVNSIIESGMDVFGDIVGLYTKMCTSAINRVMPVIVLECHMCEIDITDTFSFMSSLKSAKPEKLGPSIYIKVGQVTDRQLYPLNQTLKGADGKYTFDLEKSYMSDAIFDKQLYEGKNLSEEEAISKRRDEYKSNLKADMAANSLEHYKYNTVMDDKMDDMRYTRNELDDITDIITNSIMTITQHASEKLGYQKPGTATNPTKEFIDSVAAINALKSAYSTIVSRSTYMISENSHPGISKAKLVDEAYASVLQQIVEDTNNTNTALHNIANTMLTEYNNLDTRTKATDRKYAYR